MLFVSCSDDDGGIYDSQIELAVTRIENGQIYFELDNGKTILPAEKINHELEDNQRVRILFSIVEENSEGFDIAATIHSLVFIQVSSIMPFSSEKELDLGNDSLGIESIWIGRHYLNLSFYVYAESKSHSINLVQTKPLENDTIFLEIRHNANNDFPAYKKKGIVSFDIKELESYKPLNLVIKADTYSGEKTYYRTYN